MQRPARDGSFATTAVTLISAIFVAGCDGNGASSLRDSRQYADGANADNASESIQSTQSIGAAGEQSPSTAAQRKLVYRGDVAVEVLDFEQFNNALNTQVASWNGFIGSSSENREDAKARSSILTIRIPAENFEVALTWLDKNFYVRTKDICSEDVTEEYTDLDARLANKRNTEARLIEHLAKTTSKLDEILLMERELDRVREEMERLEGRLKFLRDVTQLSTLTIHASTKHEFVSVQAPTSISSLWTTFVTSCVLIGSLCFALISVCVALIPFALIAAITLLIVAKIIGVDFSAKLEWLREFARRRKAEILARF